MKRFILVALVVLPGCFTSWFFLNSDPDGLPCAEVDPVDPTSPRCLDGYTCIQGLCRHAGIKKKGEACEDDRQCEGGLVCRDIWRDDVCSAQFATDLCELGAERDPLKGLVCRPACNPDNLDSDQCAPGERCFLDEELAVSGYCQSAMCADDSSCGTNAGFVNLCIEAGNPPGASGLCFFACNPLVCDPAGTCTDCPALDLDGNGTPEPQGCEPVQGQVNEGRIGCIPAGAQPANAECDNANTACQPGSFCLIDPGETVGFCSRWCNTGGGAPACDAVHPVCNPVGGNVGFCR